MNTQWSCSCPHLAVSDSPWCLMHKPLWTARSPYLKGTPLVSQTCQPVCSDSRITRYTFRCVQAKFKWQVTALLVLTVYRLLIVHFYQMQFGQQKRLCALGAASLWRGPKKTKIWSVVCLSQNGRFHAKNDATSLATRYCLIAVLGIKIFFFSLNTFSSPISVLTIYFVLTYFWSKFTQLSPVLLFSILALVFNSLIKFFAGTKTFYSQGHTCILYRPQTNFFGIWKFTNSEGSYVTHGR